MERGFIQSKLEIKFLLLYILGHAEGPIDLDALTDAAMCDEGVTYFDFTSALAELIETGHAVQQSGRYLITEKGRRDGSATEDNVPYSVRMRCDRTLAGINERLRREQRIHAELEDASPDGWLVRLALDGEEIRLMELTLLVSDEETGKQLIARFRSDPEGFCRKLAEG